MSKAVFVKVPLASYYQLEKDSLRLSFLDSCGVDNWEPGMSMNEYAEMCGYSSYKEMLDQEPPYDIIIEDD